MLHRLADGECTISGLAEPFAMSFQAASKHVRVLEVAGLIHRRVAGRTHVCRIDPSRLAGAEEWLRRYERLWNERFDALEALLEAEDRATSAASPSTAPTAPEAAPRAAPRKRREQPREARRHAR
jgi:DNA-binding transcriptional ArsR family regulator